ncbi:MAG: chemotaxis protein CheB [Mariprofundus sp.]
MQAAAKHFPNIDALVIGASAGGINALMRLLPQLPENLPFPLFVVLHQKATGAHYLCHLLSSACNIPIHDAEDKMRTEAGHLYVAPPDYHMLIESADSIALSLDEPVHCCRPSIDMLFESAADIFRSRLMGVIMTGMGCDGADGLLEIHQAGGICAVQDPGIAEFPSMPDAALIKVPTALRFSPGSFGEV